MKIACPHCEAQGKKSTAWKESAVYGVSAVDVFTDDKGQQHEHDSIEVEEEWACTNDHDFSVHRLDTCPVEDCDYGEGSLRIER